MNIPISQAKAQLTDLVRRAEAGEDIILTRHGRPAAELRPVRLEKAEPLTTAEKEARYRAIMAISREAAAKATPGPDAAHSADDLYDENGLPV